MKIKFSQACKLLYIIFLVLWLVGELFIQKLDDIKYIPIIVLLFVCLIRFKNKSIKELLYKNEIKKVMFIFIVFLLISIFFQIQNGHILLETYKELLIFLLPALCSFCIFNLDKTDRKFYFNSLFIFLIIKFLYSFGANLSIESLKSISFVNSYSPFESSDAAVFLALYTHYYWKKEKKLCILAGVFTFLSFKRIDIIFVIIFPILMQFINGNKSVKKGLINMVKIFFCVSPFIIGLMLEDSFAKYFYSKFGISFNKFTMGRFDIINAIIDMNLVKYGLGTTTAFLEKYPFLGITNMHCDLMRLYIETTMIGVIVFVNNMFDLVKKRMIAFILMVFCFFVLFSSHCLTVFIIWLAMYLTIFDLLEDRIDNMEGVKNNEKNQTIY